MRTASIITATTFSLAALVATAALGQEASSPDEAEPAATELPEVVVQGATLAAPKVQKRKPKPSAPAAPTQTSTPATAGPPSGAPSEGESETAPPSEAAVVETGVPRERVGSSVSVVTDQELRARQINNVADALRSLPGVSVSRQGTASNLTVVRIRGGESNQTLVLIDGVEVNSVGTDGFFDFSNLQTEDIQQIEVLRGPQSGLYGTGAIGGVVNIVTKAGKGPLTLRVQGEGGRYEARNGVVQLSGGDDRAYGSITVAGQKSDGFNIAPFGTEEDGSEVRNLAVRGGVQVIDGVTLDGTLRRSGNDGSRDGFGFDAAGFSVASDDPSTFTSDLWVGRLQATVDPFDGAWTSNVYVGKSELDQTDIDRSGIAPFATNGVSETFEYGYKTTLKLDDPALPNVRHFLTGLIDRRIESFVQPTGDDILYQRGRTSHVGELRGEYFDTLFLTGTIREDKNEDVEDYTTWHASAALKVPSTPLRLHGGVGTGVKYPSFSEQFGFFFGFIPNPALTPEEAFGWDGGAEVTFWGGRALLDVTYFDTDLTNEIDTAFDGATFTFTPFNREGRSRRDGIEVTSRVQITDGVTVGGAYTYLDAEEVDGRREVRRAPHSGRADVDFRFDGGRGGFNVAAIYNGGMRDVAFNIRDDSIDRVTLDEYWLVTAAASYEVSPGVEFFGRVENLLNENYQEVFGYETSGAAAFAGVRFTYVDSGSQKAAGGQ